MKLKLKDSSLGAFECVLILLEICCGDIWAGGVTGATGLFLQQFLGVTFLPAVKFAPFYLWMMLSCPCQKEKMFCFKVLPTSNFFF